MRVLLRIREHGTPPIPLSKPKDPLSRGHLRPPLPKCFPSLRVSGGKVPKWESGKS
jgi:hypothetical protein